MTSNSEKTIAWKAISQFEKTGHASLPHTTGIPTSTSI